jgi:hypothetical protein
MSLSSLFAIKTLQGQAQAGACSHFSHFLAEKSFTEKNVGDTSKLLTSIQPRSLTPKAISLNVLLLACQYTSIPPWF